MELIKDNQTAFMTLIGTIVGILITQVVHLISKWIDHRNNLELKRFDVAIELEKKYLVEPVVSFIDKDLKSMQKCYAQVFKSQDDNPDFRLDNEHVFELSSVQARLKNLPPEGVDLV